MHDEMCREYAAKLLSSNVYCEHADEYAIHLLMIAKKLRAEWRQLSGIMTKLDEVLDGRHDGETQKGTYEDLIRRMSALHRPN